MIRTFNCRDTEALFRDQDNSRFRAVERVARRKLLYLHRAKVLDDLRAPPGNRLEALKGNRKGQYSTIAPPCSVYIFGTSKSQNACARRRVCLRQPEPSCVRHDTPLRGVP